MIEIDYARANALLDATVIGNEDYVYGGPNPGQPTCSYVEKENDIAVKPGCGVGVALFKAGVSLETLEFMDDVVGGISNADRYETDTNIHMTPDAQMLFSEFQALQDNRMTWGFSLVEARQKAEQMRKTEVLDDPWFQIHL